MENGIGSRDKAFPAPKPGAINPEKRTEYKPPSSFRNDALSGKQVIVDGAQYERGADGAFHKVVEKKAAPVAEKERNDTPIDIHNQPPILPKEMFDKVLSTHAHVGDNHEPIVDRAAFDKVLSTHEASPARRLRRFVKRHLSRFASLVKRPDERSASQEAHEDEEQENGYTEARTP